MGLLSFIKRNSGDAAAKAGAGPESADSVQQARTRARQRLVGAVVLVAAGVIGFPMLFESQPRALPGDIPIEIARKDIAAPAVPASRASASSRPAATVPPPTVITESAAEAGRDVAVASAPIAAATPASKPAVSTPPVETRADATPAPTKPAPKPEPKPADSGRAQALLEGKPADAAKPPVTVDGRFIVQVGAFAEQAAAREARLKVEKLGLKTYTQVVDTSAGKRIRVRVGPFATRGDAEKAADKIKSSGLTSAVYTL